MAEKALLPLRHAKQSEAQRTPGSWNFLMLSALAEQKVNSDGCIACSRDGERGRERNQRFCALPTAREGESPQLGGCLLHGRRVVVVHCCSLN